MLVGVTLVLIAIGGAAGAVTRYVVDGAVGERVSGSFPLGILVVNVSGTFALGLVAAIILERGLLPSELRAPVIVGFLGAYTTFSTLMLDSWRLAEDGLQILAVANLAGSVVLGVIAVVGGLWIGRLLG